MLEIHIIGTANSGKSTIAKLIKKALLLFNIKNIIIDELKFVDFENLNEDITKDVLCLQAIAQKQTEPILVKIIQADRQKI